ncbi:hypothetical protein JWS13_37460 [Rhodococcus pseudokoreensis]|uniref:Uncharacterized protein n=1 Tax=Rhodococcus pseudokoreensis TaxID=2811421 RepID=A0A974WB24_9NOCA|nr:hypothetical protein [Rhodococcus pseudokoreensis]QSE93890.1 hypothetical protein JWS13_37460 [Rhodococcus pseudokoreensis]
MTVLIVAAAVLAAVVVLGLIGDGSMDFYAVAEREAANQRDKAERSRTHDRMRDRSAGGWNASRRSPAM